MELYRGRLRVSYDTGSYPPSAIYRYLHAQEREVLWHSQWCRDEWVTIVCISFISPPSQCGDSERRQLPRCGVGGIRPDFVAVHRWRDAKIHQLHQQAVHSQHRLTALPGRWGCKRSVIVACFILGCWVFTWIIDRKCQQVEFLQRPMREHRTYRHRSSSCWLQQISLVSVLFFRPECIICRTFF